MENVQKYILSVAVEAVFGLPLLQAQNAERMPNILLINVDDLGWSDLSCNGSDYYETPNIDRLKERGIWFASAYAGAANSAPSRACLLTGQNTPRHGIYTVGNPDRGKRELRKLVSAPNNESLPNDIQLLPKVLQASGFQTFHVGKWHVTEDPLACGFDVNIGGNHSGHPKSYFTPYANPSISDGEDGEFLTDRLGDEARRLILQADHSRPFFLYFASYAVHTPLQAPDSLIRKYKLKSKTLAHNHAVYAALIEILDRNIGKLLQAVHELGQEKNTLIVFTSDNGGVYNISKQWPLRAGKGSFYEGGIRIPLIIYQAGVFENRDIENEIVSQLDLFPTILELCKIPTESLLFDGMSLLPLLYGHHSEDFTHRSLFWHFPAYLEGGNAETRDAFFRSRPVSVVRYGEWKLIENYEDGTFELYNIGDNIAETTNLVNLYPSVVEELKIKLNNWKVETNAPSSFQINPYFISVKSDIKK